MAYYVIYNLQSSNSYLHADAVNIMYWLRRLSIFDEKVATVKNFHLDKKSTEQLKSEKIRSP